MAIKTTAQLITDVQRDADIGTDGDAFSDSQLLGFADLALSGTLVPIIAQLGCNYYDAVHTVAVGVSGESPEALYNLPGQALAGLTAITYLDGSGRTAQLSQTSDAKLARGAYYGTDSGTGTPRYYYFRGGRIGLHPRPAGGYLRVHYAALPFPMALTSEAQHREIYEIWPPSGGVAGERFLVSSVGDWDEFSELQILSGAPPHVPLEFIPRSANLAVAGNSIRVDQDALWPWLTTPLRSSVRPGDIVIAEEQCPIVQLPHEAYPALVALTVASLLRARGDYQGSREAEGKAKELIGLVRHQMADRNRTQSATYINASSHLRLRGNPGGGWWR